MTNQQIAHEIGIARQALILANAQLDRAVKLLESTKDSRPPKRPSKAEKKPIAEVAT